MAKTVKTMIRIHDLATNEVIDREMNDLEYLQFEADQAAELTRQAEVQAKAVQRQAILDRLGLTSEEAALLLS